MNMYSCIFVQNYSIFFDDASKKMFLKYFNVISKFDFNYTMSRARVVIAYGVVENITQSEIISAFKIEITNSRFKL
jgi:L-rhamnose mutarotase